LTPNATLDAERDVPTARRDGTKTVETGGERYTHGSAYLAA